jgi:hypothetical protein
MRQSVRLTAKLSFCAAVGLCLFGFVPQSHATYLDFSGNWEVPATVKMSKKAAQSVVSQCRVVSNYSNMAGTRSGAMVVAGAHSTREDKNVHLTVRLYKNGNHDKSCHVYTDKNNSYASCACKYVD